MTKRMMNKKEQARTMTKPLMGSMALLLIVYGSGIAGENTGMGPVPVNL
jgi:hypothetical protein